MSYDRVSEASGTGGRAVVPQLHRALPPTPAPELIKSQIPGLHPPPTPPPTVPHLKFGIQEVGPRTCISPSSQVILMLLVWDHTLRTTLWKMEKEELESEFCSWFILKTSCGLLTWGGAPTLACL